MKFRRLRRRRKAFTLLEVMLVLAILLILASMVGVSIVNMQATSNERAAQAQMALIEDMIEFYYIDVGNYPNSLSDLRAQPAGITKWKGPYAKKDIPADPWGTQYLYERGQNGISYKIFSAGADQQSGTRDDIVVTSS